MMDFSGKRIKWQLRTQHQPGKAYRDILVASYQAAKTIGCKRTLFQKGVTSVGLYGKANKR